MNFHRVTDVDRYLLLIHIYQGFPYEVDDHEPHAML